MRVSKNILCFLFDGAGILGISKISFAQHPEANIWYFGNHAGLDFNSGSPVPLGNGQLYTLEGCSGISDRNTGQLLFYSHGDTIWNRNHQPMTNGTGLWGHRSATQSCLVVPDPADGNKYYVFTASAQMGISFPPNLGGPQVYNGIAYSVVDMTLDGGLGDVDTIKNVPLVHPATEKLTAVRHCNGRDYWVIAHKWNTNEFYAYLVSPSGISSPVISSVGLVHEDVGSGQGAEAIGYMKASPDQKHLALACFNAMNKAELFDFQNSTGVVSNPLTLNIPASPNGYAGPYGLSFSPDGLKLYVVFHDYFGNPNFIFQYDLTQSTPSAILASRFTVASTSGSSFGALQLATDGKLYIANLTVNLANPNAPPGSPTVGRLNNPNSLGFACSWVINAVTLDSSTRSVWGLPDFIESDFSSDNVNLGPDLYLIPPFSVTLDAGPGYTSYLWSDGSTLQTLNADTNGTYWVSVTNADGCVQSDTVHILFPVSVHEISRPTDLNIAYLDNKSFLLSFDAKLHSDFSVNIFSLDGKLLQREQHKNVSGTFSKKYELNYAAGIYILSVRFNSETKNTKLILR